MLFPQDSSRCSFCAGRAQAAELRFTQLKERHAELVTSHADLMKKVKYSFLLFHLKASLITSFCLCCGAECRDREGAVKYKAS